ncbi:hypothetical protein ACJX0J_013190, partial [Zea mays]
FWHLYFPIRKGYVDDIIFLLHDDLEMIIRDLSVKCALVYVFSEKNVMASIYKYTHGKPLGTLIFGDLTLTTKFLWTKLEVIVEVTRMSWGFVVLGLGLFQQVDPLFLNSTLNPNFSCVIHFFITIVDVLSDVSSMYTSLWKEFAYTFYMFMPQISFKEIFLISCVKICHMWELIGMPMDEWMM